MFTHGAFCSGQDLNESMALDEDSNAQWMTSWKEVPMPPNCQLTPDHSGAVRPTLLLARCTFAKYTTCTGSSIGVFA